MEGSGKPYGWTHQNERQCSAKQLLRQAQSRRVGRAPGVHEVRTLKLFLCLDAGVSVKKYKAE